MLDYKKKLIEVALPLDAINEASAKEKSVRSGHPSTLHLWWARRPLAACRAVLFASLVDDPSSRPEEFVTEAEQETERQRLFRIIEDLIRWENLSNETLLEDVHREILKSTDGNPPPFLDPFCGGGSIPLEAQRLGLEAHGRDLNPVAVLITKALIEIPVRFKAQAPINPEARRTAAYSGSWPRATALAEDVRYYGSMLRDEAEKRVGSLYPKVKLSDDQGGGEATVIAWLWTRTVRCPNPACGIRLPLLSSFELSNKPGKKAWVEPIIDNKENLVRFKVKTGNGTPPSPHKLGRGARFRCINCEEVTEDQYVKTEGQAGRIGLQMLAIVAEGRRGRVYIDPSSEQEHIAQDLCNKTVIPDSICQSLPDNARWFSPPLYGFTTYRDLYTDRQLCTLATLAELIEWVHKQARSDATVAGMTADSTSLDEGGTGASAYADAICTYLSLAIDRLAMTGNTLVRWNPVGEKAQHAFGRQALPMIWDFGEVNFFGGATGSISSAIELVVDPLSRLGGPQSEVYQVDTACSEHPASSLLISTDPPYYDNIGYADLSDFFYVWLRTTLRSIYPKLFGTMLTPKTNELIASPHRHNGSREKAQRFFEEGLGKAFDQMRRAAHPQYPLTIYYAFRQSESEGEQHGNGLGALSSTGWETMLEGLIRAGFCITGTWPMRTEMRTRQIAMGTNALASSIVLVCRPRPEDAITATRREFLTSLRRELTEALVLLMHGNVAPVDLAQASIGPGMAVYSRYSRVLETDGSRLGVRAALQIINQVLDEQLAAQEGEMDNDTRFCLAWFEQFGMEDASFGDAETLSRAKNTAVPGLVDAGVLSARAGRVRLLQRDEYPDDWDPAADRRSPVWEYTQQLVRANLSGESVAAVLLARMDREQSERARDLAYRLYSICERKGWAQEALAYNSLVINWPAITDQANRIPASFNPQPGLPGLV